MATARKSVKSTKPAAEVVEETELSTKQIVNAGIDRAVEAVGIEGGHHRYKVIRAIAFQAFKDAIDEGTFDALIDEAVKNANDLPSGWGLERTVAAEKPAPKAKAPAAKAPAKKAPAKAAAKPAAKAAAKPAARKRPQR